MNCLKFTASALLMASSTAIRVSEYSIKKTGVEMVCEKKFDDQTIADLALNGLSVSLSECDSVLLKQSNSNWEVNFDECSNGQVTGEYRYKAKGIVLSAVAATSDEDPCTVTVTNAFGDTATFDVTVGAHLKGTNIFF